LITLAAVWAHAPGKSPAARTVRRCNDAGCSIVTSLVSRPTIAHLAARG
jgi:hypothetical protein